MRCPKCSCIDDRVIDTRVSKDGESIRRRRECVGCTHRFTTYEMVVRTEAVVVKRDGRREDFDPKKLRQGIRMACWKRQVSEEQINEMIQNINNKLGQLQQQEIDSKLIGELTMEQLQQVDHVAYVRFASVYRRFKDIDQFLNEIQSLMHNR